MENTIFSFGDIVKVLLPIASDGYDYIVPENIEVSVGDFVKVPLRNKYEIGVVLKKNDEPLSYDISKIKSIFSKVKNYKLSVSQIEFIKKVADYNLTNVGNILKMVMGFDELFDTVIPRKNYQTRVICATLAYAEQRIHAEFFHFVLFQNFDLYP